MREKSSLPAIMKMTMPADGAEAAVPAGLAPGSLEESIDDLEEPVGLA